MAQSTYYQRSLIRHKVANEIDCEPAPSEAGMSDFTYRMRGPREMRAARLLEDRGLGRVIGLRFRPSTELLEDLFPEGSRGEYDWLVQ